MAATKSGLDYLDIRGAQRSGIQVRIRSCYAKGSVMKSSTKKKLESNKEPIAPNKANQKKRYVPPRFELLTPDQAKVRLTERAFPGEAVTEELLKAASKPGAAGTGKPRSIPDGAKLRKTE